MPINTTATTIESLMLELDKRKDYIEDLESRVRQLQNENAKLKVQPSIAAMTFKGRKVMASIGRRETSFFDYGIVTGSGIWGTCLCGEVGVGPGVLTRLEQLGLLLSTDNQDEAGKWWELTELGAMVARELAQ